MRAVVCTYSRHDLAAMAVASVRRHAMGVSSVVVLDASGTLKSCEGADEVRHVDFGVRGGVFAAIREFPGEPLLCIDDDVILLEPINAEVRYTAGISKPLNGHMVMAYLPGRESHSRLRQVRLGRKEKLTGYPWSEAAAEHQCELIDGVWLHIDRGSTGANKTREALEEALLPGPGAELKSLLGYVGIKATPSCPCNQRAKVMNERGCDWCEENIDTISGWLEEEAKKRSLPYVHAAGRMLIRLAIRRARKKGTNP